MIPAHHVTCVTLLCSQAKIHVCMSYDDLTLNINIWTRGESSMSFFTIGSESSRVQKFQRAKFRSLDSFRQMRVKQDNADVYIQFSLHLMCGLNARRGSNSRLVPLRYIFLCFMGYHWIVLMWLLCMHSLCVVIECLLIVVISLIVRANTVGCQEILVSKMICRVLSGTLVHISWWVVESHQPEGE